MAAYIKFDGIDGEVTDKGHEKWIYIESMSVPVMRAIPQGARDQQRTKGEANAGDVVIVRQSDKSSPQIWHGVASGKFFKTVEIHFTSDTGKREVHTKLLLNDVIITSYSYHGTGSGNPLPSEEFTLNYTKAEWTFSTLDPKTGAPKGQATASFNFAEGK